MTTLIYSLRSRVADPVHFRPDPANQNVKTRIRLRILLAFYQVSIQTYKILFHINQISSDILMRFILKKLKISPENA